MTRSKKKKLERLINASLSQSLTGEQEKELSRLLADDAEAQTLYHQLRQLDADLNNYPANDKSVDISAEVMDKVNKLASDKADDHMSQLSGRGIQFTYTARYLAAAVAGILIGIGSMMFSQRGDVDVRQLQGTMTTGQKTEGVSYMDGKTQIRLIPYLQKNTFYLNLFISAPEEVEFTITFNTDDYKPVTRGFSSSSPKHVDYLNGQIHFSVLNQVSYQFVLEKQNANPEPIEVLAMKNNKIIIRRKINQ